MILCEVPISLCKPHDGIWPVGGIFPFLLCHLKCYRTVYLLVIKVTFKADI